MARIDMQGIAHSYAANPVTEDDYALKKLELSWEDGGAYSLLGPSGCGKTTLLNIISGLLPPSQGQVLFDGQDVTQHSTQARNIAQVFQFPVVYDTMTVFDNLAFPLRNRKIPEREVRLRVQETAELLDLTPDLKRRASGLTADIKQIISLGRGLVRSDVAAILLDEPLTVIDPQVKWLLRRHLKQIHEQFRLTMILVTHDQTEALTFADQVVLMYDGRVVQHGTPQDLFEKPDHTFAGYFIGNPGINLLPCRVDGCEAIVCGCSLPIPEQAAARAARTPGDMRLGIRPEFCEMATENESDGFEARVERLQNLGDCQLVTARLADHIFRVKIPMGRKVVIGARMRFRFPEDRIRIFVNDRAIHS